MHEITITLACPDHPLEHKLFEGQKTITIQVEDPHDPNELLEKLEPEVEELRGDSDATIRMKAQTKNGMTVLEGTINKGFHGTAFS